MDPIEKRALSERDICTKFITPAIKRAGWDALLQVREEVTFTDGRVIVRGHSTSRGPKKRADYVLYHKPGIPLAVDQRIQSMTEFKQIIGRGTRIDEDYGKLFFTIIDFKRATELFADPDFDGDPIPDEDYDPEGIGSGKSGGDGDEGTGGPEPPGGNGKKYYINDTEVSVVAERIQYYGADGKLITESLRDYTKKKVMSRFASMDEFLQTWTTAEKKAAVIAEFEDHGILFEALADEVGKDLDPFDLLCHVVYGQPPLTRRERADNVKKRDYFTKYGEQARVVLEVLLEKYANQGILAIESMDVLKVNPLDDLGTPVEIIKLFGGKEQYLAAIRELETLLYNAV